jgi:hypothetical protein
LCPAGNGELDQAPPGGAGPYEYHALQLLSSSDAIPKPYRVIPESEGLPYPLIVEK